MSIPSKKMVSFQSSDGVILTVEKSVMVFMSATIRTMLRDEADKIIPVPNVSSKILSILLKYCADAPITGVDLREINAWRSQLSQYEESTLRDLDKAAQFFALGSLSDLIYYTLEDRNNRIAVQETCKKLRIPNNPPELSLGKEDSMVNDPPKERDFLKNFEKESPEDTKAEESGSIPNDTPVEMDLLKNFEKESTKAEEKARGKRKLFD